MHVGILLGLSAALMWGCADFLARYSTQRIGAYRTLFYMQAAGTAFASVYLAMTGGSAAGLWRDIAEHPWLVLFMGGASGAAMLAFYSALEVGALSVVAPIASSYPALTVLLAYASGERLTPARLAGVIVTLAGVVLAAIVDTPHTASGVSREPRGGLDPGAWRALACATLFGIVYWVLGFYALPAWGAVETVWIQRGSAVLWVGVASVPLRRSVTLPTGGALWLVLTVGLLDSVGFLFSNWGFAKEQVGVITVLGSLFSAVTLVLALGILGERLSKRQWVGVGLIFVGIVLINSPAL